MKKLFGVVCLLLLFGAVTCYANAEVDKFLREVEAARAQANSPEVKAQQAQLIAGMQGLRNASPEEKAMFKSAMDMQVKNSISMIEQQFKEQEKNATSAQKIELQNSLRTQKQLIEQSHRETIEALGL